VELRSADLRYSIRRSLWAKAAVVSIRDDTQIENNYSKSVTVTSSRSAESAVSRPLMVPRRFEYVSDKIERYKGAVLQEYSSRKDRLIGAWTQIKC
jgi:hypothetical protein